MDLFEIVNLSSNEQEMIYEHWGNNPITYKGIEIFDAYQKCQDTLRNELNNGEQECYLGYIPELDMFVSGWDIEGGSGMVYFRWCSETEINILNVEKMDELFYKKSYKYLHSQYKNLVDIRLD
jgi:hypothetical protein